MKSPGWSIPAFVSLLVFTTPLSAQLDATVLNGGTKLATNLAVPGDLRTAVSRWQEKSRSEHQTEWFSVRYTTNPVTGRVRAATNSFIELATALNRPDALGGWRRASAAFQITATGAEAALAGHRVRLAGNINSAGAVQIEKGEVKMQGHPLCIAYCLQLGRRRLPAWPTAILPTWRQSLWIGTVKRLPLVRIRWLSTRSCTSGAPTDLMFDRIISQDHYSLINRFGERLGAGCIHRSPVRRRTTLVPAGRMKRDTFPEPTIARVRVPSSMLLCWERDH